MIDVKNAAKAIGIPVERWPGQCFAIATAFVDHGLVEGVAVYGHWRGPVNPRCSMFYSKKRKAGVVQHGWVLRTDGTVVDPTRWVFEAVEPYIFEGREEDFEEACRNCGCVEDYHEGRFFRPCVNCGSHGCPDYEKGDPWPYDEGGQMFRAEMKRMFVPKVPRYSDGRPTAFEVDDEDVRLFLEARVPEPRWTFEQVHFIATLPYSDYGPLVWRVYEAIRKNNLRALIPYDNLQRAQREYGGK